MKKWSLLLIAFVALSFQKSETGETTNRAEVHLNDKEFLLDYFDESMENLRQNVEGLSETQMQYKISEENWSVSECLEHIILTEKLLFEEAKKMLEQPENPERKKEIEFSVQELVAGIMDRSHKVKASENLQPTGKYKDPETALQKLQDQRVQVIDLIENTSEEEMSNHITDSPFGPIDGYQSILFIAGHTARHTAQIEEVKADAGFPSE